LSIELSLKIFPP